MEFTHAELIMLRSTLIAKAQTYEYVSRGRERYMSLYYRFADYEAETKLTPSL